MSEVIKKPWESDAPTQLEENAKSNKWVPGMKSSNPAGRPRGILYRRSKLHKLVEGKAEAVLNVVISAAQEGDVQSANMILSKVMPNLRALAEHHPDTHCREVAWLKMAEVFMATESEEEKAAFREVWKARADKLGINYVQANSSRTY